MKAAISSVSIVFVMIFYLASADDAGSGSGSGDGSEDYATECYGDCGGKIRNSLSILNLISRNLIYFISIVLNLYYFIAMF